MPIFSRFDVVSVPFPYTDRPVRQRRPALVVSAVAHEQATGLVCLVMTTAAENRPWAGDVRLAGSRRAGLSIPSVVRPTKIATIEAVRVSRIAGIAPARAVQRGADAGDGLGAGPSPPEPALLLW